MPQDLVRRQNGPPEGPPPDPAFLAESRSNDILTVECVLFSVAFAVVLLRVYCRVFMLRAFSIDDYVMLAAVGCSVATLVTLIGETRHGLGRHFAAIMTEDPADFWVFAKYIWFNAIFIVTGISLVKISLGFFLLRVAQKSGWRKFIIAMIVFLVVFTLGCVLALILQCIPPQAAWDSSLRATATCYSSETYLRIGFFNSSINIATDFVFATVPIPMFWSVQLKMRKKFILMSILSLGYFACAAAVVKAVLQGRFADSKDMTWDNVDYFMWNSIEFHVGILTTSLPTLRPLFKSVLDATSAIRTSARDRSRKTNDYYGGGSNIALSSRGPMPTDQSRNAAPYRNSGMLGRSKRVDKYGWDYSRRSSTDESVLLEGQASGAAERQRQHATTTPGVADTRRATRSPSPEAFGQQASILRTTEISVTSNHRASRAPVPRSAMRNVV